MDIFETKNVGISEITLCWIDELFDEVILDEEPKQCIVGLETQELLAIARKTSKPIMFLGPMSCHSKSKFSGDLLGELLGVLG